MSIRCYDPRGRADTLKLGVEASRRARADGLSVHEPRSRVDAPVAVPCRAMERRGPQVSHPGLKPPL